MSDSYTEYCEEQAEKARKEQQEVLDLNWNELSNDVLRQKLVEIKSSLLRHIEHTSTDIARFNLGNAKEHLLEMKCMVLNKFDDIGV